MLLHMETKETNRMNVIDASDLIARLLLKRGISVSAPGNPYCVTSTQGWTAARKIAMHVENIIDVGCAGEAIGKILDKKKWSLEKFKARVFDHLKWYEGI